MIENVVLRLKKRFSHSFVAVSSCVRGDELSIQNAIMVTRSSRYPLMVDPQGQANRWIKSREKARISENPSMCITTLSSKNLKDQIEFTMGEGLCLIIENVENEVDPMLDPVLDKQIIKKGRPAVLSVI